jgi:hypothetical protein
MSLYSYNFSYLPRPERSILSLGSESTRAVLPNFDNVTQLNDFTTRLIVWKMDVPGLFTQVKTGASYVCLLIVIASLILARRVYKKTFWLIRIIRRPEGIILVPNPVIMFSLLEGIFGVVFVASLWIGCDFFGSHSLLPNNQMLWLMLPWCPLVFGAIWATWGTYFATPNALQSSIDGSRGSIIQRILLRPIIVNMIGLLTPLGVSISILIPAIISDTHWQKALHMMVQWQATYSQETAFTQEMVQASQRVWFEVLKATHVASIVFILWTCYALIACIGVTVIYWGLISAIRDEIDKQDFLHEQRNGMIQTTVFNVAATMQEEGQVGIAKEGDNSSSLLTASPVSSQLYSPRMDAPLSSLIDTGPIKSQRRYLRGALAHAYIQLGAIAPACVAFAAISLLICLTIYGKMEHASSSGGNQYEHFTGVAVLTGNYTICFFGTITLGAILHRTYEPVLLAGGFAHFRSNQSDSSNSRKRSGGGTNTSFFETRTRSFFETHTRSHGETNTQHSMNSPTSSDMKVAGLSMIENRGELEDVPSLYQSQTRQSQARTPSESIVAKKPSIKFHVR